MRNTARHWPIATKNAELKGQIDKAGKSIESADDLAKEIEELKAATDAERVRYELKLAGCRSVRAGRVLLADHKGDMAALKKAEPWLFGKTAGGGATGLEPTGASKGESDELKRWYAIAGIEDKEQPIWLTALRRLRTTRRCRIRPIRRRQCPAV